jgi:hypothetical protein
MNTSFSTTVSDWQGIDDEPTVGSDNLVKSGGVKKGLANIISESATFNSTTGYVISASGVLSEDALYSISDVIKIKPGETISVKTIIPSNSHFGIISRKNEDDSYTVLAINDGFGEKVFKYTNNSSIVEDIILSYKTSNGIDVLYISNNLISDSYAKTISINDFNNITSLIESGTSRYVDNLGVLHNSSQYNLTSPIKCKKGDKFYFECNILATELNAISIVSIYENDSYTPLYVANNYENKISFEIQYDCEIVFSYNKTKNYCLYRNCITRKNLVNIDSILGKNFGIGESSSFVKLDGSKGSNSNYGITNGILVKPGWQISVKLQFPTNTTIIAVFSKLADAEDETYIPMLPSINDNKIHDYVYTNCTKGDETIYISYRVDNGITLNYITNNVNNEGVASLYMKDFCSASNFYFKNAVQGYINASGLLRPNIDYMVSEPIFLKEGMKLYYKSFVPPQDLSSVSIIAKYNNGTYNPLLFASTSSFEVLYTIQEDGYYCFVYRTLYGYILKTDLLNAYYDSFILANNKEKQKGLLPYTSYMSCFDTVGFIGDSLTAGTIASTVKGVTNGKFSYPTYLKKITGIETIYNWGDPGETAQSWQNREVATECFDGNHLCDAYLIGLGTNEAGGKKYINESGEEVPFSVGSSADVGTTNLTYWRFMTDIISRINTMFGNNVKPKIFLISLEFKDSTTRRDQINNALRDIADYYENVYFVDIRIDINNWDIDEGITDTIHKSAIGYYRKAETINCRINEIVSDNIVDFRDIQFIGTTHLVPPYQS